jgi:hypothetical protein
VNQQKQAGTQQKQAAKTALKQGGQNWAVKTSSPTGKKKRLFRLY